ncbi:MAG: 1-phosphofructokinase, partial [uncultured Rubrobacteraceae bacterium]
DPDRHPERRRRPDVSRAKPDARAPPQSPGKRDAGRRKGRKRGPLAAHPGRAGAGCRVRRRAQRRRYQGRPVGGGHPLRPCGDRGALPDLHGHRRSDERLADGDQRVRPRREPGRGPGVLPAPGAPDGVRDRRRLRRQRPAEHGGELSRRPRPPRPR